MKKNYFLLLVLASTTFQAHAQLGKLKGLVGGKSKTDTTASAPAATPEKTAPVKKGLGGLSNLGSSIMTKAVTKIATAAGGMMMNATGMVSTTADLTQTAPIIGLTGNLHPSELGTAAQTFLKGWKTGGDLVSVMFSKKDGVGVNKIDGTVLIDGKPATYLNVGTYVAFAENDGKPKKVEITTTSGQKSSFEVQPYDKPFKIKSINGQTEQVALDLTKDVIIEFEKAPEAPNNLLHLTIAINQLGIKSFYDLPYIKTGKTITIPAAAFRNINILPAGKALYSYQNSYLSVAAEKNTKTANTTGDLPAMNYDVSYSDGRPLTVTKEPALNLGLTTKGTQNFSAGEVDYSFLKPNAFLGRPFSQLKSIGVTSFAIRGTTYTEGKESKSSTSFTAGNTTYTTVTTTKATATFPQVKDQVWDAVLESLYPDFIKAVQEELGGTVLPLQKITATQAYQDIAPFSSDDENTSVNFSRAYQNSKLLSAFRPVNEGYGVNSADNRIMQQAGANALMKFTFDLQIALERGKPVMIPKLAFEMTGETHGPSQTKYCTATLIGKGQRYPEGNLTVADIEKIIRKSDLLATFRKGLQEIKAKEQANPDYQQVWSLQQ
ncbi:hypothetical protein [Rufibacter sp. LB8]|uniref:hypothetical protein n=1 Tax=Rufibacter sp. LB8 TaxID=2777781 RepID=UPI00178C2393|nr:hypothetical protein [Rufibacter sp. LB8]